ncbi:MAG: hypothetical protein K8S54_04820 [Spirochaetia bacterium]|nr:hypothetical protein [Spirochaetia bacterium]
MQSFRSILIGGLLACALFSLQAKPAVISASGELDLTPYLEVLPVQGHVLAFKDIQNQNYTGEFRGGYAYQPGFGFGKGQVWARFEVDTRTEILVESANPWIDTVDLYCSTGNTWSHEVSGDIYPFAMRRVPHRNVVLTIPGGPGPAMCYIAYTTGGTIQIPLTLWSKEQFHRKSMLEYGVIGLYFGGMIVLLLYNFFIYITTYVRPYIYYCMYIAGIILTFLVYDGLALQLSPLGGIWLSNQGLAFVTAWALMCAVQFSRAYLESKRTFPEFDIWLRCVALFLLVSPSLYFIKPGLAYMLIGWTWPIAMVSCLILAIVAAKRGIKHSKFFLLGWSAKSISSVLVALWNAALIPTEQSMQYAYQAATVFEGLIFAFGLARMRHAVRDMELQLRSVARRLMRVREEERATISQEVGEEFAQDLAALRLALSNPDNSGAAALVEETIGKMRAVSIALRPSALDNLGLASALRAESVRLLRNSGLNHVITIPDENILLGRAPTVAAFRIYQEALRNILQHARARQIKTSAVQTESDFTLKITDDGIGIPVEAQNAHTSSGLQEMLLWANEYNGSLQIESRLKKGTTITLILPRQF